VDDIIKIPFNPPRLVGREHDYMGQDIDQGHQSGDGVFVQTRHHPAWLRWTKPVWYDLTNDQYAFFNQVIYVALSVRGGSVD
jgi:hypothetical protein